MRAVRRGGRLLVMAALAGGLSVPLASQVSSQPQPVATGLILGQVVDAGTGQPIAGTVVALIGGPPPIMNGQPISPEVQMMIEQSGGVVSGGQRVLTGPQGQFVFHSLKKGSYRLSASAPGYVPGQYGQRRVNGASKPIELEEGEHVGDASIKLWKYASISGRVTDDAGEPAVGMQVRVLRAQVSGTAKSYLTAGIVQTDDRGVYRSSTLIPGEYIVVVPQTVTTMPMSVVEAYYEASRAGTSSTFVRQLSESNAPFPSIGPSLRVGDYQVGPTNGRGLTALLSDDRSHVMAFATTYYPAAPNSSDASVVKLASGQDQTGADIQLRLVPTVTVSGTVSDAGGPVRNTGVRLVPVSVTGTSTDVGLEAATTATDASGAFALLGVPPGQYTLKVRRVPQPSFDNASRITIASSSGGMTIMSSMPAGDPSVPTPPTGPALFAELPVSVAEHDVRDLPVTLRAGAHVSGRIVFEGSAPPPAPAAIQRMLPILSNIDVSFAASGPGTTTPDGQFTTSGYPPGRYFVNVGAPGMPAWTLQSVTLGGRNLDESPLELGTSDIGGVIVTLTDHPSEIRGTVHAASSASTATTELDATVIVFPSNYRDWIDHGMSGRRQRSATVGRSGTFTLTGLPPGDYLAAAVNPEAIENTRDPKAFDALARVASHFALTAGEKKSIDLTVVQIR
ncbi:MAG TPA: carboxypeptidase-like regulatory domain-containing protein [Vicinamibacterales bacterium]|nr:carboxypeptidase-like regulatory domain-containing protein [Vicinamibacterales bacterium]